MNIYVRYFANDALLHSVDEVVDFLSSIPEIMVTPQMVADIKSYAEGDMPFPKRYKVRPRVYFIMIKTNAATMEEFKANNRNPDAAPNGVSVVKEQRSTALSELHQGWYKATMLFKRVIQIPGTMKFQYQDTRFSAMVLAESGMHCYERMVDHLKNRQDVDLRSQFPSVRGANFEFEYLGEELQECEE